MLPCNIFRCKAILKEFHDAVKSLKNALHMLENVTSAADHLSGQQKEKPSSPVSRRPSFPQPSTNSVARRPSYPPVDKSHTEQSSGASLKPDDVSTRNTSMPVYLDLSIDNRNTPFGAGIAFRVEATSIPKASKGKRKDRVKADAVKHIIAEGGHFEHLVHAHRPPSISRTVPVIACGVRVRLTQLEEMILTNRKAYFASYGKFHGLPPRIALNRPMPQVLVVSTEEMERAMQIDVHRKLDDHNHGLASPRVTEKVGYYTDISRLLFILRGVGVHASDDIHQLQGMTPHYLYHPRNNNLPHAPETPLFTDLCRMMGIPLAVAFSSSSSTSTGFAPLSDDTEVKIRHNINRQLGDVVMPLRDLPAYVTSFLGLHTSSTPPTVSIPPAKQHMLEEAKSPDAITNNNVAPVPVVTHQSQQFVFLEKAPPGKDKKPYEKHVNACKKKVDRFMQDVIGASASVQPKLPVIASDVPFMTLREFGTLLGKTTMQNDASGEELMNFVSNHASHKRQLKLAMQEMATMQTDLNTSKHALLYSMTDDKFDLVTFVPSHVDRVMQNSTGHATATNKSSKSIKK